MNKEIAKKNMSLLLWLILLMFLRIARKIAIFSLIDLNFIFEWVCQWFAIHVSWSVLWVVSPGLPQTCSHSDSLIKARHCGSHRGTNATVAIMGQLAKHILNTHIEAVHIRDCALVILHYITIMSCKILSPLGMSKRTTCENLQEIWGLL